MATTDATPDAAATLIAPAVPDAPPAGDGRRRRERLGEVLVVAGPAVLALALSLYQLTARSLWLDESATVAIASQHGGAFGVALAHDGGNMLGYYAVQHVLIGLFGSGAFVIRLPSALAAAATSGLVAVLALRLFDRRTALAAGLLSAVSLSLVYWGQDARGYAPMVALIAASFLALLAVLEGRGGWRAWLAYVALGTAAVYAGLEAVLVVPAQLLVLLWYRHRARAVLSAVAVTALCCVPLAVLAGERGSGQLFWVPKPSLRIANQVLQALTSSGLQPSFYTSTGTTLAILTLVVLAAGLGRMLWLLRTGRGALMAAPGLAFAWLLVPLAAALLESTVGQSVFQARYMLVSLPAVALLLGWVVAARPVPRLLALAMLGTLLTLRALQLAPAYGVSPENWRAATAYVMTNARPGDCVAFYPRDNRMPFQYYLRAPARAPRPILPTLRWGRVRPYVEDYTSLSAGQLARLPSQCRRVWLVSSHEGRVGGPAVSQGNYLRFITLEAGLQAGYPHSRIASFGFHGAVAVTLYSR
ncbi:MAG TPA: glycosyltransferase family 39 protein [Solirubrobacteraceae bacterium]|nr:glycosyltransferase family 39 protein [Solirubrobacteraceae bacterium]